MKSFLIKFFTISGAGGGPAIFFGISSTNREEQRQFKWSINLDLKDKDNAWEAKGKGGYWLEGLKKEKWQGVSKEDWEKLSSKTERSIYKLAFRSTWTQETNMDTGKNAAKGALGLIKASWGGGNKELKVEEIKVSNERKVWLIIAKGKDSIYLIPAVRSSNGRIGSGEVDKKMDEEGVRDIKEWTERFDKEGEWEEKHNECLEKEYRSGINITRASSFVSDEGEKIKELKRQGWSIVYYEDGQEKERGWSVYDREKSKGQRLSLNAGKMTGKQLNRECRKSEKNNKRYFPLDIFVFGNSEKLKDGSSPSRSLNQTITIEDNITQVIGVRLDQVVISETGIGDGKENKINWGTVSKPSLIRELLK